MTNNDHDRSLNYFKNNQIFTYRSYMFQHPFDFCQSLAELFNVKTTEDALAKATKMSDAQIIDLVRQRLVDQVNQLLASNWLIPEAEQHLKVINQINVSDYQILESPLVDLINIYQALQQFVNQHDCDENKPLDDLLPHIAYDEAYICYETEHVIVRIGEHVYFLDTNGNSVGFTHNQTRLAGKSLTEAIENVFELDDIEKDPQNWKAARVEPAIKFI